MVEPAGEWLPATPGWIVLRVAAGVGYALQGSSAHGLNGGDAVIVGPACKIIFRASQLGVLRLEFFAVLPQNLNGLITVAEWRQLADAAKTAAPQPLYFSADDALAQRFTRLAAQKQNDSLAARSAMLQLWASAITGLLPVAGSAADRNILLRDRFRKFIGQMPEAELAKRSLPELAGELRCSERHFSRLFREEFKVSLRAHQTELRLERARQLLGETNAKIVTVAHESGYRHLGLFNAMFKKRFGVTPSGWRLRENPGGASALSALVSSVAMFFQCQFADMAGLVVTLS